MPYIGPAVTSQREADDVALHAAVRAETLITVLGRWRRERARAGMALAGPPGKQLCAGGAAAARFVPSRTAAASRPCAAPRDAMEDDDEGAFATEEVHAVINKVRPARSGPRRWGRTADARRRDARRW